MHIMVQDNVVSQCDHIKDNIVGINSLRDLNYLIIDTNDRRHKMKGKNYRVSCFLVFEKTHPNPEDSFTRCFRKCDLEKQTWRIFVDFSRRDLYRYILVLLHLRVL